jgi:NADH dehydrogenase
VRVLVTGGTGFVGPKVVHELRARGHRVRTLVRRPDREQTLLAWGCELAAGDMTDPDSLRRAVERCDAVVHLVSVIRGPREDFGRVMVRGTHDLVSASREAGVGRFVLMSALGVSERNRDLVPYFRAKWEMERTVHESGLEHVILRPSFVFGRDGGILPMILRQVRLVPVTPVVGPGHERLQPIWVDDVASCLAQSVELLEAANRTFELGGPDVVTWNRFYERARTVLGVRRGAVHVPVGLARFGAGLLERLPGAPVTRDQLTMLTEGGDNVCDLGPALETFELPLVSLDDQLRRAA